MGGPRGPPGAPDPDNKKEGDNWKDIISFVMSLSCMDVLLINWIHDIDNWLLKNCITWAHVKHVK